MIRQTLRFISRKHRKPLLLTIFACFITLMADLSYLSAAGFQGSLSSVSITDAAGTNTPPSAKFTFSQNGDTFSFNATGSSDSDGSITKYMWDFGDGASATGAQVVHTYTNLTSADVTLTVIDDASGVSLIQQAVSSKQILSYAVNFQPATSSIPSGYVADSGEVFSSSTGYGWIVLPNSQGTRDRDSTLSPDQAYDTMIHVKPSGIWQIVLPSGSYTVTICAGDPGYTAGIPAIQAEGVSVIAGIKLSSTQVWIEKTAQVAVSDGALTVTFTGSTDPARLCWIKITSN